MVKKVKQYPVPDRIMCWGCYNCRKDFPPISKKELWVLLRFCCDDCKKEWLAGKSGSLDRIERFWPSPEITRITRKR